MNVTLEDEFNGDNAHLIRCIEALISLNDNGSLVPHGIGGDARAMLSAAAVRLSALTNTSGDDEAPVAWRWRWDDGNSWIVEADKPDDLPNRVVEPLYARPQSAAVRDDVSELLMAIENAARMAEQGVLSVDGGQAAVEIRSLVPIRFRAVPQSAAVRDGWQPIEAAPRSNGSDRFLAFIPGHGACVCACTVLGNVYSVSSNRTVHKATHWMPLPAAPALHSTQEG